MTFNRDGAFSGWCCADCLFLLANGDTPADLDEAGAAEYLARVARITAGTEVTLGMFREDHACATNYTVAWHARTEVRGTLRCGTVEVRADGYADAMDVAYWAIPAGAWLTVATAHDLETEADRGGDCECEQVTFSWSECDVCRSGLGGSRDAVVFWPEPDSDQSEVLQEASHG